MAYSTGLSDVQRTLLTAVSVAIMSVNVYIATVPEMPREIIVGLGIAATIAVVFRDIYGVKEAGVAVVSKKVDETVDVNKKDVTATPTS